MNEIQDILQRLTLIENKITPVAVKSGLNKQQKKVHELPALFKPKNISVLSNKTDPQHPTKGYFVGAESVELSEQDIGEDILNTVKKSLTDYLKTLDDKIKNDADIKDKKIDVSDLKTKPEFTGTDLLLAPVKTIALDNGKVCEIHGDTNNGFEVRHNGKSLPTRFDNIDHACMAVEMYASQQKKNSDPEADYMEER
jgi:hypothetical protein